MIWCFTYDHLFKLSQQQVSDANKKWNNFKSNSNRLKIVMKSEEIRSQHQNPKQHWSWFCARVRERSKLWLRWWKTWNRNWERRKNGTWQQRLSDVDFRICCNRKSKTSRVHQQKSNKAELKPESLWNHGRIGEERRRESFATKSKVLSPVDVKYREDLVKYSSLIFVFSQTQL